jgi:hypothetical protein
LQGVSESMLGSRSVSVCNGEDTLSEWKAGSRRRKPKLDFKARQSRAKAEAKAERDA